MISDQYVNALLTGHEIVSSNISTQGSIGLQHHFQVLLQSPAGRKPETKKGQETKGG